MKKQHTIEARADGKRAYVLYNNGDEPLLNIALKEFAEHLSGQRVHSGLMTARRKQKRSFEFLFKSRVRSARFVNTIDKNVIWRMPAPKAA